MSSVLKNLLIVGLLSTGIPKAFSSDSNDSDSSSSEVLCGGDFTLETTAFLKVPNNPKISSCEWELTTARTGQTIAIFFDSFQIDDGDNCTNNYLSVKDGDYDAEELIGVFCGKKIPPNLRTVGNRAIIKFERTNSMEESQFSATVVAESKECRARVEIPIDPSLDKEWHLEHPCGRTFGPKETSGIIKSPCFPGFYPRNKDCIWKIEAPLAAKIKLNFTQFNLWDEQTVFDKTDCTNAFVDVSSMDGEKELKNHGTFCGSKIPESIISEGNSMEIIFKSSSMYNYEYQGFALEFSHQ